MAELDRPIDRSEVPAHVQVQDRILADIASGRFQPGDQLPGEPVIAERLGVSRMTANKAILALVGKGVLERVRGKGTFVRDHLTRQLRKRCAIAICSDTSRVMEDYYFGQLFWQMQGALDQHGYEARLTKIDEDGRGAIDDVDAVIAIAPVESAMPSLSQLSRGGIPVVIVGAQWRTSPVAMIDSDNVLGACMAVNHLVELGHRRLAFVGALPDASNTIDRVRGFRVGVKSRGIESMATEMMFANVVSFTEEESAELNAILRRPDRPTAIVCGGPSISMFVKAIALAAGLSIPDDLSIVAYDDPAYLAMAYPAITTVRQPLPEMAVRAVEELVARSARPASPQAFHVFDPSLVVRQSTTQAPKQTQIPT